MLIKIPTDIWRDIFDWFSLKDRRQFALKFNELGDREFSNVCQKWLHEWTKNVCLEKLWIFSEGDRDSKLASLLSRARAREETVPFAEVEMPDNITDFEEIVISYLDTSALNFLRRMQPLFRRSHLNFAFYDEEWLEATRTAHTYLMPLFSDGGIEHLETDSNQLLRTIRVNFHSLFFGIKTLVTTHEAGIDEFFELYLPWLSTRRADGQPRTLSMRYDNTSVVEILDRIRQNFLDANNGSASFSIRFSSKHMLSNSTSDILGSITQNAITSEQLVIGKPMVDKNYYVGMGVNVDVHYLLIGRCPAEVDGQTWIEEMHRKLEEAVGNQKRTIFILNPTIGQIEEAQQQMGGNEVAENGAEEKDADQQPGPSNRF